MKTHIATFLTAVILFTVLSCDKAATINDVEKSKSEGSLFFSLQKSSIPVDIKIIAAKLERTGYPTISDSLILSSSTDIIFRLNGIPTGTWILTVQAKDSTGKEKYKGSASVAIVENQTVQVSILMNPTSSGSIEIGFVWGPTAKKWMMDPNNPILKQTPGTWDADHIFFDDPCVLKIGGTYLVWYTSGYSQSINGRETFWIAHATSSDGIHWTNYGPVISPSPVGSWMDKGPTSPTVLYENGIYKMWFEGASTTQYHTGIGYATSTDGKVWAVNAQPIISPTTSRPTLWGPGVMKKDALYYMYFGISNSSAFIPRDIYLMASSDGINWSDQGKVLSARSNLSWENAGMVSPYVLYDENKFKMFYTGLASNADAASIGYAESADGIHWVQTRELPVLTTTDTSPWNTLWVAYPSVMREGSKLKMWFSGLTRQPYRWQIGYAEQ